MNQNDSITLPNTITFRDAVSAISYDNTAPGQAAVITYTYNDVVLGTASIDFTASEKGSSVFGDETTGTTDGAEATAATQSQQHRAGSLQSKGGFQDEPGLSDDAAHLGGGDGLLHDPPLLQTDLPAGEHEDRHGHSHNAHAATGRTVVVSGQFDGLARRQHQ